MTKKNDNRAVKAYHNRDFLNGHDARSIRILCEFHEPMSRLRKMNVESTVVFFGSSRLKAKTELEEEIAVLEEKISKDTKPEADISENLRLCKNMLPLARYYDEARELSRLLTNWAEKLKDGRRFLVCSGGGEGIMEAANRGARDAGGESIGFNISLPMNQELNPYISPEYSFEFYYFFFL